jgi:ParB-like chromosome segregation protein Spo0J
MADYNKVESIPIRDIHEDQDNVNAMDKETFEALIKSIEKTKGIIEPIVTMECSCDVIDKKPHRKIIGGEHRWRAASDDRIAMSEVPCIDYLPTEQDDEKFLMVNLNTIHGVVVPQKMARLITYLTDRHSIDSIKEKLNFTNKQVIDFIGREEATKQGIAEQETEATKKAVDKEKSNTRKKLSQTGTTMFILQMDNLDKEYVDEAIGKFVELNKGGLEGNIRSKALGQICKLYVESIG